MKQIIERTPRQLFVVVLGLAAWMLIGTACPALEMNRAAFQPMGTHCPQPGPPQGVKKNGHPEQFKKDLQQYVTKEAELTIEEAKRFFPVYFEMKEKLHGLERQKNRAIRQAAQSGNEKDCQLALDNEYRLNLKSCKIEQEYNQRLVRIVGAKKYTKVREAEHRFGRKMFHRMAGKRRLRK